MITKVLGYIVFTYWRTKINNSLLCLLIWLRKVDEWALLNNRNLRYVDSQEGEAAADSTKSKFSIYLPGSLGPNTPFIGKTQNEVMK